MLYFIYNWFWGDIDVTHQYFLVITLTQKCSTTPSGAYLSSVVGKKRGTGQRKHVIYNCMKCCNDTLCNKNCRTSTSTASTAFSTPWASTTTMSMLTEIQTTPDAPVFDLITNGNYAVKRDGAVWFLAPLVEGQRAIVTALCLSCVRQFVRACFRKLCFQKPSQRLLTGFLPNLTRMFLRWSSFNFLQIILFHEEFWLPWQLK